MRAPAPVRNHPNATFVFVSSPIVYLFGWGLSRFVRLPEDVSAMLGAEVSAIGLAFSRAIKAFLATVWTLGIIGVCRRVWRGDQSPPRT